MHKYRIFIPDELLRLDNVILLIFLDKTDIRWLSLAKMLKRLNDLLDEIE